MPELISPLELGQEDVSPDSPDATLVSDLDAVREMVLRAHPDIVPELVAGDSVAALLASVEPARSAYARLAEAWGEAQPQPVSVPAGGGAPFPIDPAKIPSAEKIRRGLQVANRRTSQEG